MHKKILDKLRSYQKFESYDEVAESVEKFLAENLVTETQLRALRVIQNHAKVVPGVAMLKYKTIAEYVGRNIRTVQRAIKKLVELGIIEKHARTRELRGGDGANIYTICAYADAHADADDDAKTDAPGNASNRENTEQEAHKSDPEYVEYVDYVKYESKKDTYNVPRESDSSQNGEEIQVREDSSIDKSFVPSSVPEEFADVAGRYLKNAVDVYKLYKRAIIAANKIGAPMVRDDLAMEAFKQTLFRYKSRQLRGSFLGYFYKTYKTMHEQELAAEARRESLGGTLDNLYGADVDDYEGAEDEYARYYEYL